MRAVGRDVFHDVKRVGGDDPLAGRCVEHPDLDDERDGQGEEQDDHQGGNSYPHVGISATGHGDVPIDQGH